MPQRNSYRKTKPRTTDIRRYHYMCTFLCNARKYNSSIFFRLQSYNHLWFILFNPFVPPAPMGNVIFFSCCVFSAMIEMNRRKRSDTNKFTVSQSHVVLFKFSVKYVGYLRWQWEIGKRSWIEWENMQSECRWMDSIGGWNGWQRSPYLDLLPNLGLNSIAWCWIYCFSE